MGGRRLLAMLLATLASTSESLPPMLVSTLESLLPTLVNGSWTLPIRLEISSWTCSERLVRKPPCCSEPASQRTVSSAYSDVQLLGKRVSYLDAACGDCLCPTGCLKQIQSGSLPLLLW